MGPSPDGTIYMQPTTKTINESDFPDYFEMPLKTCNEILVSVKASQGAEVALYSGKFETSTTKPIIITFGAEKNTKSTITVHGDCAVKAYADNNGLLHPNVHKSFRIQWNRNLISVTHEGDDFIDSFIWYKSPTTVEVDAFGVRSVGSNASFVCQNAKPVNTTDGGDFQHFAVVSGKLEFQAKTAHDAYVTLRKTPKNEAPVFALSIGPHSTLFHNGKQVGNSDSAKLSKTMLLGFWIKWDAGNFGFGKANDDGGYINYEIPKDAPEQLNYFGITSGNGSESYWKITDSYKQGDYDNFLEQKGNACPKKKADWER